MQHDFRFHNNNKPTEDRLSLLSQNNTTYICLPGFLSLSLFCCIVNSQNVHEVNTRQDYVQQVYDQKRNSSYFITLNLNLYIKTFAFAQLLFNKDRHMHLRVRVLNYNIEFKLFLWLVPDFRVEKFGTSPVHRRYFYSRVMFKNQQICLTLVIVQITLRVK